MEALIMAGQLILALTIMVGLHEFGHLWAAKSFGMRVEKYYIGFPPKIIGKKIGETEYALGAIPLGGFVKISGMIDESLDTKNMSAEPEPWEFRAKPAWQRLIVMLGGIIMNVITGIIVFVAMNKFLGDVYIPKSVVQKEGIAVGALGEEVGFRNGDILLKINGQDYERLSDAINPNLFLSEDTQYLVDRGGEQVVVKLPETFMDKYSENPDFISVRADAVVAELIKDRPAEVAGLEVGDKITHVDGQPVHFTDEVRDQLFANTSDTAAIRISRDGEAMSFNIPLDSARLLGFRGSAEGKTERKSVNWGQAFNTGTYEAFNIVYLNIVGIGQMISGKVDARKSLRGPIGIAEIFGGEWQWLRFWRLVGLLSMVLAFMNLLPIPALDGGHVMFLSYEIISGRKPGDKFLENAQKVGMVILLALMVFVIGNDIIRLF